MPETSNSTFGLKKKPTPVAVDTNNKPSLAARFITGLAIVLFGGFFAKHYLKDSVPQSADNPVKAMQFGEADISWDEWSEPWKEYLVAHVNKANQQCTIGSVDGYSISQTMKSDPDDPTFFIACIPENGIKAGEPNPYNIYFNLHGEMWLKNQRP